MIQYILLTGLLFTSFVIYTDTQDREYDWIESCYGIECTDPEPLYDDGISYWNYRINI